MAKFEREGYCPLIWAPMMWNDSTDPRINGLWNLVGPSVVYAKTDERGCTPDTGKCDEAFGFDPISYDLLSAIVKKNPNADKILVHQLHNGASNTQSILDIQKVMSRCDNPELVVAAESNFTVVIADTEYGLDLWVWDLRACC